MPRDMHAPEIIAHRGASRERPENTLAAFTRAVELGADGIELDVHATRNGIVVVHHDPVPRATPDDPALAGMPIAGLSLKELKMFSIAPNTGIPALAQVLRAVPAPVRLYVEVKGRGIERLVVETIAAAKALDRCAVHAFDHRVIPRVRTVAPGLATGILTASYLLDPVHALRSAEARDYWMWWEHIDAATCDAIHEAGGRVIAWTVNEAGAARDLVAMGVDGVCTDDVAAMRAAFPPRT